MKTDPWALDEALALYRDDPRFPAVMAATHPSMGATAIAVSHSADDELIALVTIAAIRASMEVAVAGVDSSVLRVVARSKAVADALGRDCLVTPGSVLTVLRFSAERTHA